MTTLNPLIDGMMKVARLAAAAQCANAPEGTAPGAQVHAEGFEQALRALRAACPLPFEKVPLSFPKISSAQISNNVGLPERDDEGIVKLLDDRLWCAGRRQHPEPVNRDRN